MKKLYCFGLRLALFFCCFNSFAADITATHTGNWGSASTWGGTLPANGDHIYIPVGVTVTLNANFNYNTAITNLDISGTLTFTNSKDIWLYATNPQNTSTLTVHPGSIINGGNGNSHIYIGPAKSNSYDVFKGNGPSTIIGLTICNILGCSIDLPIRLTEFSATPVGGMVQLSWITISESNNDYFTIERSGDARAFSELLEVKGAGTSQERLSYSAVDNDPLPGTSYYRLKQTDYNGEYAYSKLISVTRLGFSSAVVAPNPTSGAITLLLSDDVNSVSVFSSLGKSVYQSNHSKGKVLLPINLSAGIYYVHINQKTTKVIVL